MDLSETELLPLSPCFCCTGWKLFCKEKYSRESMVFDGNTPLDNYTQLLFLAHSRTVDEAGAWSYMAAAHSLVFLCTQPEIFYIEPQV